MPTIVTSKGQVTVPKSVRDYLGLKAGSAVSFERLASGEIVLRPVKRRVSTRAKRLCQTARPRERADEDRRNSGSHAR